MSMNFYPEVAFGLMLNEEETEALRLKVSEERKEDIDVYELAEIMEEETGKYVSYYDDDFTGTSFIPVNNHDAEGTENVHWMLFLADRGPSPFYAAYHSMAELTEEFKKVLEQYLPKNFNWENHIGTFMGVVYC